MQQPAPGRIVLYTLSSADAAAINKRRADAETYRRTHPDPDPGQPGATGHQAHLGNHVAAGKQYPAVVVRVFHPTTTTANLQVLLDGTDTYWATSRQEGEGGGFWSWPARAVVAAGPRVPAVGDVVHYVSHGTPPRGDGTQAFGSVCRNAVVTEVELGAPADPDGAGADSGERVGLAVLNPTGTFFRPLAAGGCRYHDGAEAHLVGGTWHWPQHP